MLVIQASDMQLVTLLFVCALVLHPSSAARIPWAGGTTPRRLSQVQNGTTVLSDTGSSTAVPLAGGSQQPAPPGWRPTMACTSNCLAFLGFMVQPVLASRRLLLRQMMAPYMPDGMDMGFIVSRQVAQSVWTPLLVENSTYQDVFAVDAYFEGVGSDKVPHKMRGWVRLAARMGHRYKYYARIDTDTVIQPVGLYERLKSLPTTLTFWCREAHGTHCGGVAIVLSADLVQAIVTNVPDVIAPTGDSAHDDIAITEWARRASNNTARACFVLHETKETALLYPGGIKDTEKWANQVGPDSIAVHGPKRTVDYLIVWEVMRPYMEAWKACVAAGYNQPGCSQLQAVAAAPRCAGWSTTPVSRQQ